MVKMGNVLKKPIRKLINKIGYDIVNCDKNRSEFPADFTLEDIEILRKVIPYTMTSSERIYSLIRAVEYIVKYGIQGNIVECGVWKGGSMMAIAQALINNSDLNRELFLFDTFEGMPEPKKIDVSVFGMNAGSEFKKLKNQKTSGSEFYYAPLEEVKRNFSKINYDIEKVHFIKGKVEDTLDSNSPQQIALLRLDTDWYESTKYEMKYLFPRLKSGGVLIIDDYGHWAGAKKAIDEYLEENKIQLFLSRIDYTGRIAIKF